MATSTQQAQAGQASSFLELPAELRNEIYRLAMYEQAPITLTSAECLARVPNGGKEKKLYLKSKPSIPGIIYACRQTNKEALAMYFSINTFSMRAPMHKLATGLLGWDAMKHIKHIAYKYRVVTGRAPYVMHVRAVGDSIDIRFEGVSRYEGSDKTTYAGLAVECTCAIEKSLRAYALERREKMGGKMGLAWGVALGFECRYLSRLTTIYTDEMDLSLIHI